MTSHPFPPSRQTARRGVHDIQRRRAPRYRSGHSQRADAIGSFQPQPFLHTAESADGTKNKIASLSYSQTFKHMTLYATAFTDLDNQSNFGVFAGLSIPFGGNINANTGVQSGPNGLDVVADVSKSLQQEDGSVGWRLRTSEGQDTNREATVSYRAPFAQFEAGVQQQNKDARATARMDGAIAVAGAASLQPIVSMMPSPSSMSVPRRRSSAAK